MAHKRKAMLSSSLAPVPHRGGDIPGELVLYSEIAGNFAYRATPFIQTLKYRENITN